MEHFTVTTGSIKKANSLRPGVPPRDVGPQEWPLLGARVKSKQRARRSFCVPRSAVNSVLVQMFPVHRVWSAGCAPAFKEDNGTCQEFTCLRLPNRDEDDD